MAHGDGELTNNNLGLGCRQGGCHQNSIDGHNQDFLAIEGEHDTPIDFIKCFLIEFPSKVPIESDKKIYGTTIY